MNRYLRGMNIWRALLLVTCSTPVAIHAQSTAARPAADARSLRLAIATDRSTYRTTDSVSVRFRFLNDAQAPITFLRYPPWADVRLVVTDSAGRVVAPTKSPAPIYIVSSRKVTIPGGGAQVPTWNNQEWFSLRNWGYELTGPGRYTIVGLPVLSVVGGARGGSPQSNRVTITVAP